MNNVILIAPDGTRSNLCSEWYAVEYCKGNPEWKWEYVSNLELSELV